MIWEYFTKFSGSEISGSLIDIPPGGSRPGFMRAIPVPDDQGRRSDLLPDDACRFFVWHPTVSRMESPIDRHKLCRVESEGEMNYIYCIIRYLASRVSLHDRRIILNIPIPYLKT